VSGVPGHIRKAVLERDGYKCTRCDGKGSKANPLTMHHKIPKCEGGKSTVENLETVCCLCHRLINSINRRSECGTGRSYSTRRKAR
jgi:5-methylcytosine-specific restriction endonuclease McrA